MHRRVIVLLLVALAGVGGVASLGAIRWASGELLTKARFTAAS